MNPGADPAKTLAAALEWVIKGRCQKEENGKDEVVETYKLL